MRVSRLSPSTRSDDDRRAERLIDRAIFRLLNFEKLPRQKRRYRQNQLIKASEGEDASLGDVQHCLNCGAVVTQSYCARCGQRDDDLRRPAWTFLLDFGDDLISWDSRLLNTIGPLLLLPGFLTRAYVRGKRSRFVPPVRLYLIASILFFLVVSLSDVAIVKFVITKEPLDPGVGISVELDGVGDLAVNARDPDALAESQVDQAQEVREKIQTVREELARELAEARAEAPDQATLEQLERAAEISDKALEIVAENADIKIEVKMFSPMEDGDQNIKLPDGFITVTESKPDDAEVEIFVKKVARGLKIAIENPRRSNDLLNTWLPRAMFVLLPIFAVLLRLFYWGKGHYLINQFIFSLHFHTFIFLVLTFLLVAQLYWGATVSSWAFLFVVPLYLFIGLKVVSGQGLIRTFFKFGLLSFVYMIILLVTVSGAVLFGLSEL